MSAGTQSTHSQTRVETPDVTANPRVVEVVQPLIDRLQELIREKNVSYDEWHQAVHFVIDVADSGEMPLLMDVFFEATVDAVANAASAASTTAIEGPFYPMFCLDPGDHTCWQDARCGLQNLWGEVRVAVRGVFERVTLAELATRHGRLTHAQPVFTPEELLTPGKA